MEERVGDEYDNLDKIFETLISNPEGTVDLAQLNFKALENLAQELLENANSNTINTSLSLGDEFSFENEVKFKFFCVFLVTFESKKNFVYISNFF